MVTRSRRDAREAESTDALNNSSSDELRREGALVAGGGLISKRTMAIAFGLVFLVLALTFAEALGSWGAGILALLGLVLTMWGAVCVVSKGVK